MKKWLVISWLVIVFSAISLLFWYNEWRYSLPTPVPAGYNPKQPGEIITISNTALNSASPLFIHFFNPNCPCSRFNIPHFKSLVKQYGTKTRFVIVVLNDDNDYTVDDIQNKFGLDIPVYFDKSIADSCGVYSTPQAVILDKNNKLYYRGNYNKSRYCTDKKSNYAQMALDSLLSDNHSPVFSLAAIKSYGCELPECCKK